MSLRQKQTTTILTTAFIACQYLTACGSSAPDTSKLPAVDDSRTSAVSAPEATSAPATAHKGMSNGQKMVILAGAAALYYMYKKNQEAHKAGTASEPQYYLSKNGRVYYREKGGRVHWVTPPTEGVQVPQSEASEYQQFQGYDNSTTGKTLTGLGNE